MLIYPGQVTYRELPPPQMDEACMPPDLPQAVYTARLKRLLDAMAASGLHAAVIYGDREHGTNFGYFTGFEPRFEEGCLVVHQNGTAYALLGNENLKMHQFSRIPVTPIHVPWFSLPNQPMTGAKPLRESFAMAELHAGMRVGMIGWKLFANTVDDGQLLFDVPHFIVQAVVDAITPGGSLQNAAALMIHSGSGIRATAGVDEIAHYEYAASLASRCVYRVMEAVAPGKTEMELAGLLNAMGQPLTCYSMCAAGERFSNAVVYPRNKAVALGDRFTVSMGLRGGLTCRAGYVAYSEADLPIEVSDYMDAMAKPYFTATATWFSTVGLHVPGREVYEAVETVLPRNIYGWTLNPGHLTATEEWTSSPIDKSSDVPLRSGMILQMDIIPRRPPYGGINAEDGVLLADDMLQAELLEKYPDTFARMRRRRSYMQNVLGIPLKPEVLPMSDTVGYLRPLLLNRNMAFSI